MISLQRLRGRAHRLPNMRTVVAGSALSSVFSSVPDFPTMWSGRLIGFAVGAPTSGSRPSRSEPFARRNGRGDVAFAPVLPGPWWSSVGLRRRLQRSPCRRYPRVWPPCGRSSWAPPAPVAGRHGPVDDRLRPRGCDRLGSRARLALTGHGVTRLIVNLSGPRRMVVLQRLRISRAC